MYKYRMYAIASVFLGLAQPTVAAERPPGPPVRLTPSEVVLSVDDDALDRQYRALSAMPSVKVTYSNLGLIRHIAGDTGLVLSSQARASKEGDSGAEVLEKLGDLLLASGGETLAVRLNTGSATHERIIRLDQSIRGIPVLYGSVGVNVDEATGIVRSIGAHFLPDRGLPRQPNLSPAKATELAIEILETQGIAKPGTVKISDAPPSLAYHGIFPDTTRGRLVWVVLAFYVPIDKTDQTDGAFWIDAIDGEYVGRDSLSRQVLNRTVYTANGGAPDFNNFPNNITAILHEGDPPIGDQIAMNAYNNAEKAYVAATLTYIWNASPLGLVVRYNTGPPNAYFTRKGGVDYLRFSDGNASRIPYGNSQDVVAHEFGHAMVWRLIGILPGPDPRSDAQSAAIDEGFGDVVAINVDAYHSPAIVPATWVLGEVFTSDPNRGLRSAANPKGTDILSQDWFPARMLGKQEDTRHANSTIMSHAYYLLANGGFDVRAGQPIGFNFDGQIPSLFVPGLGNPQAAQIFHKAFQDNTMLTFPTFPIMKAAAENAASALYGEFERDAVHRAFTAVGVGYECSTPPAPPSLTAQDLCNHYILTWPDVLGATSYHGQRKPSGWTWANSTTIVDGNYEQCNQWVSSLAYARLRACNGCGCSAWSNEVALPWYPQCP